MESATLTRLRPGPIRLGRLRAVRPSTWAKIAFAVMCVGALIGYFAYPTYPTYDSFYALLWGRDLLHLHLPDFRVYRGPTEHPLAIAFGMFCSIFGQGGARLMVLGSIASFVARRRRPVPARAPVLRPGRRARSPALLVLSRFFVENLAAQGYLDISYVALIVWAVVLEVEKPRRGTPVLLAAGGRRPAAPRRLGAGRRLLAVVLVARREPSAAEVPRAGGDRPGRVGVGRRGRDRQPALLAELDGRAGAGTGAHAGPLQIPSATWTFAVRIDKLPVLLGALAGLPLAIWLAPRRVRTPLAALVLLLGVFVLEGAPARR